MDYDTARGLIAQQMDAEGSESATLLDHLRQGKPPVPGQVTSLLLALKVIFDKHQGQSSLERSLITQLHQLAWETRRSFEQGTRQGVSWPPLLSEDLGRVAAAVQGIFADQWPDIHHH